MSDFRLPEDLRPSSPPASLEAAVAWVDARPSVCPRVEDGAPDGEQASPEDAQDPNGKPSELGSK